MKMVEVEGKSVVKIGKRTDDLNLTVRIAGYTTKSKMGGVIDANNLKPVVEIDLNVDKLFETLANRYAIIGGVNRLLEEKVQEHLITMATKQKEYVDKIKKGKKANGGVERLFDEDEVK